MVFFGIEVRKGVSYVERYRFEESVKTKDPNRLGYIFFY